MKQINRKGEFTNLKKFIFERMAIGGHCVKGENVFQTFHANSEVDFSWQIRD